MLRQRGKKLSLLRLKKKLMTQEKTAAERDREQEFERVQLATCVLLLEVAKSDDEFSSVERTTMEAILEKKFGMPAETIDELVTLAQSHREESTDIWEYTNLINENFFREEKIKIIESAWKIIYADKKLDKYEDHLVHKLAKLLRLRHDDLIKAKLRVLEGKT